MDALSFALAVVAGLIVGILSGMLGVGGGLMMIPLFRLGYALEAIQATATSLAVIVPTSLAGLVRHVREGTCVPLLGVTAGLAGSITSVVGVHLADASPGWLIMVVAAVVIGASSINMLKKALRASELELEKDASELLVSKQRMIGFGILVGLAAGLMAGYIGVGGGIIMIPLFVSVLGLPMKKASGTSLIAVCILAIVGVVQQWTLGNVQVVLAIAFACGSIPGAFIGAGLVKRLPERTLRLAFGCFLLVVAVILALNELLQ